MRIINNTPFNTAWSKGYEKDGRELLVVIIKATYMIPEIDGTPELSKLQIPIIEADVSSGEPGYSATLYETDYSTFKPACDVLLNGCAHVPFGDEVTELVVSMRVGNIDKKFLVVGNRTWGRMKPQPFSVMPISYDNAFGGTDRSDVKKFRFYRDNPIGTGYSYHQKNIDDMPLPNTEEIGRPVNNPKGSYKPMALGAVARSWPIRAQYAGTYDEGWIETRMPFWPDDFDFRFFQSAAPDQQLPYLKGGEAIELVNLSPNGLIRFNLPAFHVPVNYIYETGTVKEKRPFVDTLLIEPEFNHFTLTARTVLPLENNFFDIKEVIVGQMPRTWYHQQRAPHKQYYADLSKLIEN